MWHQALHLEMLIKWQGIKSFVNSTVIAFVPFSIAMNHFSRQKRGTFDIIQGSKYFFMLVII